MYKSGYAGVVLGVALFCGSSAAVDVEWIPVSSTGSFTIDGNEITVPEAGVEIRLDLFISDWDRNLNGLPLLGLFEVTLDPASYSSGPGAALEPLRTPDPSAGAFQILSHCLSLSDLMPTGRRCDPPLACVSGEVCVDNDQWILAGRDNSASVSTATLAYSWLGISGLPCVEDDGSKRYAGTLIVVVPPDAFGTYTFGFVPDPEKTSVRECQFQPLTNINLIPGKITIETGRCCLSDQCAMTSRFVCESSPTGTWLQSSSQCPQNPICAVGACCLGPGECRHDFEVNTKAPCEQAGGTYFGRVNCLDFPCPACGIVDDAQCKLAGGGRFFTSDAAINQRIADDVRLSSSLIGQICWQGIYNDALDLERSIADCSFGYEDAFTLAVYLDGGGYPDEALGPVAVRSLFPDKGPQAQIERIPIFEYSAMLVDPIEVNPNDCYWIQIQNDRGAQDGCYWQWAASKEDHNLQSGRDVDNTWKEQDIVLPFDMTMCLDQGIAAEDCGIIRAACCTPPARCSEATLSECLDLGGMWNLGHHCDNFVCTRPTGACCDLSTSSCSGAVEDIECPRPLQWNEGAVCADVICEPTADIAFVPVSSSAPFLLSDTRNEIILAEGDAIVELEVRISGWDTDRNGVPTLGAIQATLDTDGYASGAGSPLTPLDEPNLEAGAFQITRVCATVPDLTPTSATCDPPLVCPDETLCIVREGWVFGSIPTFNIVVTGTPSYEWLSVIDADHGALDDGTSKYGGTFKVVVPADAAGTYTIGFINNNERSFLNDDRGVGIPHVELTPVRITIESGKCCFNVGNDPTGDEPPGCAAGVTRAACRNMGGVTSFEPNALVCGGSPSDCSPACLSIVQSNPAGFSTDARQPHNLDGSQLSGWDTIELFVEGEISAESAQAVRLVQRGGSEPAPGIETVTVGPGQRIVVFLDQPLQPQTSIDLGFACSDSHIELRFLPGDVDGDGRVHALDVLALVDALNGVGELPIWSSDIDRDGRLLPRDLIREIDLLNGAGEFDVWLGAGLP